MQLNNPMTEQVPDDDDELVCEDDDGVLVGEEVLEELPGIDEDGDDESSFSGEEDSEEPSRVEEIELPSLVIKPSLV